MKGRREKRACERGREGVFRVQEENLLDWKPWDFSEVGQGCSGQEGELRKTSIKKTEEKRREKKGENLTVTKGVVLRKYL